MKDLRDDPPPVRPQRQDRDLWQDKAPIRADLFGAERLEHHARTLAAAQPVARGRPARVLRLSARLKDNAAVLLTAYRASAAALDAGQAVTPAAEWLLDNYHLVEDQLQQIVSDLPPGYYRQLPKLSRGPFTGYPRVFGLAWAYIAHTDSLMSGPMLTRFVAAYQEVQPLQIGELWAVAITLRIVLVENMRRLAEQIIEGQRLRLAADLLVDRTLGTNGQTRQPLHLAVSDAEGADLSEITAAQIAKRLRGFDPAETPLRGWLEDRLRRQGALIDDVVASAQSRQVASNVTMRNIVTSMRQVSETDWADFFEAVSPVDARLRAASGFAALDFASRNRYRSAIEVLARCSARDEISVAEAALAQAALGATGPEQDPGHALIGAGRGALEAAIGFAPPVGLRVRRGVLRLGLGGYLAAIALASGLLLWLALSLTGLGGGWAALLAVLGALAATEAGTALVNLAVTRSFGPMPLPALDLAQGVPDHLRTLVAVPVILTDTDDLARELERLEVHHLSSTGGAMHYALLTDGPDAATEQTEADGPLIRAALAGIAALNARYPTDRGDRFLLLHRRRLWNPAQRCWMGWERKRGKLTELNRLLRGATDTSFMVFDEARPVPEGVRFVVTLDADTRLLRDTVQRMIGKMAHPLNRPVFDPLLQRVTGGYGILQPRVTASLPLGQDGSVYQQVFSSRGGIEPYAAAVSDVYQDLFDEGSFTGKGIYDVDAFEAALAGRVPENTLLSHDLFEGIHARAALVSDIEVVEDFPARYEVDMRRQHRWARGDWQLIGWITGLRRGTGGLPPVGRWKMIDNLRRSLVAPATMAALLAGWLLPLPQAVAWTACLLTLLMLGRLLPLPFAILPGRAGVTSRSHGAALLADLAVAGGQVVLGVIFLPDAAWRMADAIIRTAWRLGVSRRNLLEWVTAAQTFGAGRPSVARHCRLMAGGMTLGLAVPALAVAANPAALPLALPFAAMWLAAPAVAALTSRPRSRRAEARLRPAEIARLRQTARRTWRFFETFVTEQDNFLPPDNFQETPRPEVAHRTSPTNIGLYLLSVTAAHDLGWIGRADAALRLDRTLQTLRRMPRFRGHLHNWHDTRDLRVLDPAYVSSVDSGNLAGHLIAVARACRDWGDHPVTEDQMRAGVLDTIQLAQAALAPLPDARALSDLLDQIAKAAGEATGLATLLALSDRLPALAGAVPDPEAQFWTGAVHDCLTGHRAPEVSRQRLLVLENLARDLALEMDFGFLLQPEKKLLSIGFSVATNTLDSNCYDLLASEARLASLFAIAKGDVPTRHWFRLGRSATPIGAGSALISWSGSMFEYLMPSLVMRAPAGSVLEQTNRLIVARQQSYAASIGIPWGISESSYNARDLHMTYQYSNFGVPGLGLKRGLQENRVIAPYASGLAAMVDARGALQNYDRLARIGAEGRFGFYEAVDFTASRVPAGLPHALVRSFMAHHQGMTITAIANTVQDGRLRARFHAEPMIQAVELLLQERVPRDAVSALPRAESVHVAPVETADAPAVRLFETPDTAEPTAHLLSNGSYGVMLTPTGAGFSRWRGMAVTRWRPDPTQNALGSFLFLRDVASGEQWSPAVQPVAGALARQDAEFGEHRAMFTHHHRKMTTRAEIVVSSEDDAEARRVTLTNTGRTAREVDVTSYAELVLAPASADIAHPAFSKLFVVTDYLAELGVIIATRRRRSPDDPGVWAAHIAVVEGTETAAMQFETDRARFIGRGNSIRQPVRAAEPLSGTVGTVLDPIFSIRRRISIPAGDRARVTFWTLLGDTPDRLLDLVDRHRDPSAFDRAETLAWTQAQVQLRHLGISREKALEFQQLSGGLLQGDARLRTAPSRLTGGLGPQSGLWHMGISGDLPLVVLLIDDAEDLGAVREALDAHEYWRMRQFAVDLVILNERASSYVQDLQSGIEAAIRTAQARPRSGGHDGPALGAVHAIRSDLIPPETKALLLAVAGAVLVAGRGGIGGQLAAAAGPATGPRTAALPQILAAPEAETPPDLPEMEFFNGTGGFAENGREYVTVLRDGQTTPAPWINVVANPGFGFQVSAEGGGHVWSENSRENQLTPWSNDPVSDPPGEAIYLKDLDSGILWTPTALPIRTRGTYVARHGFGYSRFQHGGQGILCDILQLVPMDAPVKISRIRLTNRTGRVRRLSVTGYAEWVLGASRSASAPFVVTEIDPSGAVLARNPWGLAFPGRVAFADLGAGATATASRMEFLGPTGRWDAPDGLRRPLSGSSGPGLDPCAALQRQVVLVPGATVDLVFQIGQAHSTDAARALIARIRGTDIDGLLADVTRHWTDLLGAVQVRSPDRAMDVMLNGWLLYQTLACRIWARAGFYQASGAYGFRDQLQDGMALTFSRPEMTREHLLRAAGRQFPEGDVQHWWLPHSGQGVRTRISDDRVWLGYGVARYVAVSGDAGILDETVPFLQGPALRPGAHDDFFLPEPSGESASLFEHCARGLDQALALTGANGMPLIGTGDWNDGMNRVGEGGAGTSVWLGWLLIATIGMMAPLADSRDPGRAARWRAHAQAVRAAIERDGWDGAWYRRGTFDDGTLLGSATSEECRIDSIAQSWAVLSGAAQPDRARQAMASMTQHLIRPDPGLALLFTPPFDRTPLDPGYIKGYPPGLRENGGQYSHAAMWAVLAHARLGDGDAAGGLFALLNPINHALTPEASARYKVEPYVIAADVYSTPPHEGRGGWSWYTGSAGWMYRAGIEGLLGLNRAGPVLTLAPCFPRHWPRLEASVRVSGCSFDIVIDNANGLGTGIAEVVIDGVAQMPVDGAAVLPITAGGHHRIVLRLGPQAAPPVSPG